MVHLWRDQVSGRQPTYLICAAVLVTGYITSVWALTPLPVAGQCGSEPLPDSSCTTCHLVENPPDETDLWHGIHVAKDCCINCHGGNCRVSDKDLAHLGMTINPLQDIYTNCHSCHPDDYQERAEIFATELGIIPSSNATPTAVPTSEDSKGSLVVLPVPVSTSPSTPPITFVLAGLAIITIFAMGLITIVTRLGD